MNFAKQIILAALGIVVVVAIVVAWKHVTGDITSFLESTWCAAIQNHGECRIRGYQHFLVWTTTAIVTLLILGLLLDRLLGHFRD